MKLNLADIDPEQRGIPYGVWKAKQLNQLFKELGKMRQHGRILPRTVEHGLMKELERLQSKPKDP